MMGGADDDSASLDSDSDLILDGDGVGGPPPVGGASMINDDGDTDSDELEVNEGAAEALKNRKSARVKQQPANDSDDEF